MKLAVAIDAEMLDELLSLAGDRWRDLEGARVSAEQAYRINQDSGYAHGMFRQAARVANDAGALILQGQKILAAARELVVDEPPSMCGVGSCEHVGPTPESRS